MATENTNVAIEGVDTSSPSPLERRNSLEKHLQTRPDEQDLKNRHILLDTKTAPALQAAAQDLERQRITDNLKKGLSSRPDKETLVERNILPSSTAAPALQAQQRELEKHMRADSLEKQLQNRPKPEELVKDGILEEDENPLKEA
ncbi:MAG: hypothetical protein M1820_005908 [Bogoriella megaspora]|nr:MAG: hypothetical protein M1820_005908 [Bogoriella megaspora]